jgi:hypothetical protein
MSGARAPEDVRDPPHGKPVRGSQRAALSRVARESDHIWEKEVRTKKDEAAPMIERADISEDPVLTLSPVIHAQDEKIKIGASQAGSAFKATTIERIHPVPASIRKSQSTPVANSSILASAKFKRTRRQPSILQIGRQEDTLSDSDLDDMLAPFEPDDESTPFRASSIPSKLQPTPSQTTSNTTSSQGISDLNPRKRKITPPEIQVPRSPAPISHCSSPLSEHTEAHATSPNLIPSALSISSDVSEAEPDLPAQKMKALAPNRCYGDVMAPPQSSSPLLSSPAIKSKSPLQMEQLSRQTATTVKRKQPSRTTDTSSKPAAPSKKKPLQPLSTSELQKFLPRRRRQHRKLLGNDYDIPLSSEAESENPTVDEDEDELSFIATKGRRTTSTSIIPKIKRHALVATAKKNPSRPKAKKAVVSKLSSMQKSSDLGPKRTYSRRDSDKENMPDGLKDVETNDSLLPYDIPDMSDEGQPVEKEAKRLPIKIKDELKTLAKKFQEVDQWEMEFEEVTASSSSQLDAR